MASEWIELTDKERNELIYVNLAKARLILRPMGEGSEIWFLGGVREDGMVLVNESVVGQFDVAGLDGRFKRHIVQAWVPLSNYIRPEAARSLPAMCTTSLTLTLLRWI